jgi:sRNA-binding regulator protein Hfq
MVLKKTHVSIYLRDGFEEDGGLVGGFDLDGGSKIQI